MQLLLSDGSRRCAIGNRVNKEEILKNMKIVGPLLETKALELALH